MSHIGSYQVCPPPPRVGIFIYRKDVVNYDTPPPVIPDAGVSLNVSPLPAVGITDVRYLT